MSSNPPDLKAKNVDNYCEWPHYDGEKKSAIAASFLLPVMECN